MSKKHTIVKLLLVALSLPAQSALAEPAAPPMDDAANFSDRLLEVAGVISSQYFADMTEGELIEQSVRGLYARLSADIPADVAERLRQTQSMKEADLRGLLTSVWEDVARRPGLSPDRVTDLALEEMARRLDGLTWVVYGGHRLNVESRPPPADVGLKLASDPSGVAIRVVTPLLNGPAYKAGLRAGDLITRITLLEDSERTLLKEPVAISTNGLTLAAALKHLAGAAGTRVGLTYQRPPAKEPTECVLVRDNFEEETVMGFVRKRDDGWDYWVDPDKKIAYIRLARFGEETAADLDKALNSLQKDGMKGLILDLRLNPGGRLPPALGAADLLVDKGVIATIRSRGELVKRFEATQKTGQPDFPVVCLTNRETAQAGEVVAACLQDHRRAVIMGERTAGNGACRYLVSLTKTGGYLIVTGATLYRPSGKKLHRWAAAGTDDDEWGVTPDAPYVLRLSSGEQRELADHLERRTFIAPGDRPGTKADVQDFKDRQLEMALAYIRTQFKNP